MKTKIKIKRNGLINLIAFVLVLLVVLAAAIVRKQTVTYNLVGGMDSSFELVNGETVVQTYSPNRRNIIEFDFKLSETTSITGEYTLVVTEENNPENNPILRITNTYSGEEVDALKFEVPSDFAPNPGVRLNLFITGAGDNVELAADSSYRSMYRFDNRSGDMTLGDNTLALDVVSEKNYKWFLLMSILLFTFGVTFLVMHFFKDDFESNVAPAVIFTVFLAYAMGMLGLLKQAPIVLYVVALIGIALFFWDCNKKDLPFYKCLSSGMILWAAMVVILFATIHHTYIGDPDTVYHINKCKYMYWTDALAFERGYYYFIPVLAYLFETINGLFSEDLFLLAIIIYNFSLIFSFIDHVKLKDSRSSAFLKVIILGLCTFMAIGIKPEAFFTAMMDVPFSLTLAYIILNIYSGKISKKSLVRIVAASIALMLVKRAGLPAVLVIAVVMLVHAFRYKKSGDIFEKKYLIAISVMFLSCVLVSKTIDFYCDHATEKVLTDKAIDHSYYDETSEEKNNSIPEIQQATATVGATDAAFENNKPAPARKLKIVRMIQTFDPAVAEKLVAAFFSLKVYMGLSYAEALCVIWIIAAVVWIIKKDEKSSEFFRNIIELTIGGILYYGVISYKYIYAIESYNKYTLNAFDRYAIHFIGAIALFEAVSLIGVFHKESDDKNDNRRFIVLASTMMLISYLVTDFEAITDWIDQDIVSIENNRDDYERALSIYYGYGHRTLVYIPWGTFAQSNYFRRRTNLEFWNSKASFNVDDLNSDEMMDDFAKFLYDNFEYLYLVNYDEAGIEYGLKLFENGIDSMERHSLYHVDKNEDGTITLVYLGQIPLDDDILRTYEK